MAESIWTSVFLGVNGIYDIKHRKILLCSFPVYLIIGIILWWKAGGNLRQATALLPGFLFLCIGKITKEAIGYGDGLTVLMLGICHPLGTVCEIVLGGLMLGAVWGGILVMVRKKSWKQEFPWIPWLFLAYIGRMVIT
ncbi:MAG: hypothetical protein ACOX8H_01465 [Ruminococcus sp.]